MSDMKVKFMGTYSPVRIKSKDHKWLTKKRSIKAANQRKVCLQTHTRTHSCTADENISQGGRGNKKMVWVGSGHHDRKVKMGEIPFDSILSSGSLKVCELLLSLIPFIAVELNKMVRKIDHRIAKAPQCTKMQPKKEGAFHTVRLWSTCNISWLGSIFCLQEANRDSMWWRAKQFRVTNHGPWL